MTQKNCERALQSYPAALKPIEVAEILRVSIKTAYKIIKTGEIPSVKIGRERRVAKSVLISYLLQSSRRDTNTKCVVSDNTQKYC